MAEHVTVTKRVYNRTLNWPFKLFGTVSFDGNSNFIRALMINSIPIVELA